MTKAVSILKKKIESTYKAINDEIVKNENAVENGSKSINDALSETSDKVSEIVEARFGFDFNTLTFVQGLITMAEYFNGNTAGDMTEGYIMSLINDAANDARVEVEVKTIRERENVEK